MSIQLLSHVFVAPIKPACTLLLLPINIVVAELSIAPAGLLVNSATNILVIVLNITHAQLSVSMWGNHLFLPHSSTAVPALLQRLVLRSLHLHPNPTYPCAKPSMTMMQRTLMNSPSEKETSLRSSKKVSAEF